MELYIKFLRVLLKRADTHLIDESLDSCYLLTRDLTNKPMTLGLQEVNDNVKLTFIDIVSQYKNVYMVSCENGVYDFVPGENNLHNIEQIGFILHLCSLLKIVFNTTVDERIKLIKSFFELESNRWHYDIASLFFISESGISIRVDMDDHLRMFFVDLKDKDEKFNVTGLQSVYDELIKLQKQAEDSSDDFNNKKNSLSLDLRFICNLLITVIKDERLAKVVLDNF